MSHSIETVRHLAASPAMAHIRQTLEARHILQTALAVQQIPAPTFAEDQRADYVRRLFERSPLRDVMVDEVFNVYGCRPGQHPDRPALLVSAHLDTVFPADTDLSIRYEHERVYGPGLGDNSMGVACLLTLLDIFQQHNLHPAADIWFVANSREEGLGDLGGMRAVWQRLGERLGAAVILEGLGLGRIYHAGIAVRRLHIICQAEGGHSWQHFGRPTATHGLIALGAQITAIQPPTIPRTTYNIGMIGGGHSVNSLATHADMYLDMRSEHPDALADLETSVRAAMQDLQKPGLSFSATVVGDRPAGYLPLDHPLLQIATAALELINQQAVYEAGSTDANIPLANRLPAVTIGITYGGNSHRLDEYVDIGPLADGVWHALILVLAAAEHCAEWPRLS